MAKSNGFILHESASVVVIVTGTVRPTANEKTGDMLQVWILPREINPVAAVRTGEDKIVCGNCKLRGVNGKNRGCYVKVYQAPRAVWEYYRHGGYPILKPEQYPDVFSGRQVRFGSYGEPTLIPFKLVQRIAEIADGWTGYTHQWRRPMLAAYKRYFMASCSVHDYAEAEALGWRTFTISNEPLPGHMLCPASAQFKAKRGWKLDCEHCGICKGNSIGARSVTIPAHGEGQQYAA